MKHNCLSYYPAGITPRIAARLDAENERAKVEEEKPVKEPEEAERLEIGFKAMSGVVSDFRD